MKDHGTTFVAPLVRAALTFLVVVLVCVAAVAQGQSGNDDEETSKEIFALLNQARAREGLPPLTWDDRLAAAALRHAELMAERGTVAHDLLGEPDLQHRLAVTGVQFDRSGENVAFNADSEAVHEAFMKSREHRENILDQRYNAVGIAAVERNNGIYVAQEFAHRLPELTAKQFKEAVVRQISDLRKHSPSPGWRYMLNPALDKMACDMARKNKLDTDDAMNSTGALFAAVYTAMTADDLPDSVMQMRDRNEIRTYSVGTCFARTQKYPAGAYWVVAVFMGSKPTR